MMINVSYYPETAPFVPEALSTYDVLLREVTAFILAAVVLRMLIDCGVMGKVLRNIGPARQSDGAGKGGRQVGECPNFLELGEPLRRGSSGGGPKAACPRAQADRAQPTLGTKKIPEPRQNGCTEEATLQATELFRSAARSGTQALERALAATPELLLVEGLLGGLQECVARDDLAGAAALDRVARQNGLPYNSAAYELLLRLYCKVKDGRGLALFDEMLGAGLPVSFHQLTNVLARCAESQNLDLAQRVHEHLREQSMAGLIVYKTLTKVYACCGRFDLACDIYDEVLAAGLEPDAQMYACLMRFAVQCGRIEMSKALYQKAGKNDKKSHLWLIRSAGKEGKVGEALRLLRELRGSDADEADISSAYTYTIEALTQNGAMDEAQKLLVEMRSVMMGSVNLAVYSAVIKGYCSRGQLLRARRVISEIEEAGQKPDAVCFNLLISAAVSKGEVNMAWSYADEMRAQGVRADNYTLSILLKAARQDKGPRNRPRSPTHRALSMLDSVMQTAQIVAEDEVLLNTALDLCTFRKDHRRLAALLRAYDESQLQPAVHTYGLLIKACSILGRSARGWALWREMTEKRVMVPNDLTLSCMLDFLATNNQADKALQLWKEYEKRVPANTIIYSTLMKGFANVGNVEASMALFDEMKSLGLGMNTVTYTILLDAHARAKNMDEAMSLLRAMEQEGCYPNKITYNALIKGFTNVDNLDQAYSLLLRMRAAGVEGDAVVFNILLEGCVRCEKFELADMVLADLAKSRAQSTSFTLNLVVKMWGKRRNLDAALAAVEAALRDGLDVDATVCTSLLTVCCNHNAYDRAIGTFQDMKARLGSAASHEDCYAVLISRLAKAGRDRCAEAARFADEAASRVLSCRKDVAAPLPDACATLLKELARHNLHAELTSIRKKLIDAKLVRS